MKKLSIFFFGMFGVGVLMMGGFFLLTYMSGDPLVTETIFDIKSITNPKAASKARSDPERYRPLRVKLSPEMNPIVISSVLQRMKRPGRSDYDLQVMGPDGELFETVERTFRNSKYGKGTDFISAIYHMSRIEVDSSGEYELRLIPLEKQSLPIVSIDLRLRRNASEPSPAMVFVGFAFGMIGMTAGIFSVLIAQTNEVSKAWGAKAKRRNSSEQFPDS